MAPTEETLYNVRNGGAWIDEPSWPALSGEPLVFLVDASSRLEARLLEAWIARVRPEGSDASQYESIALPPTRRRRANATLDRLEARLAAGDDLRVGRA